METTWNCNLHRWLLKINRHYAELYQTLIPKGRYLPNLNICVPIHTYIHVSFNSETFLHLSFCAVSLNALNDSSEPYTVIPIVLALYRGSIFKLCVLLWCIFPSHGLQSRPLAHTSEHFENIRKGCKVAEMYYFFLPKASLRLFKTWWSTQARDSDCVSCFPLCFLLFFQTFFKALFSIKPEKHVKPNLSFFLWLLAGHEQIVKLMCKVNKSAGPRQRWSFSGQSESDTCSDGRHAPVNSSSLASKVERVMMFVEWRHGWALDMVVAFYMIHSELRSVESPGYQSVEGYKEKDITKDVLWHMVQRAFEKELWGLSHIFSGW